MVMPFLPFAALQFHASAFQVTLMPSVFSLAQVVGTLILGRMSDKVGRRKILLLNLCGAIFALTAAGLATNYNQLVIFRGFSGFFNGTVSICQAFIVDLVDESARAGSLAMVGAVMAV